MRCRNSIRQVLNHSASPTSIRLLLLSWLIALFGNGCTEEKTYITNNPPADQRPPTVEWVSIDGRTGVPPVLSDTVEIVFLARDTSGIDSARLYLDGVIRFSSSSSTSTSSFTYTWNTLNDSDGLHTLVAVAYDKSGNLGTTPAALNLRVSNTPPPPGQDRLPPSVQWLSPAGGSIVSDTVNLAVQAFDSSGIDSVRLYLSGFPRADWVASPTDTSQAGRITYAATFEWNTLSDSDGIYVLEARAWDEAGNVGFCPALVLRVHNNPTPPPEDRTPPSVEWLLPRGGGAVQGEITLSVKAVDSAGVSAVWISKNGYAPAEWRFVGSEDSLYSVQWNTRNDSDGVYSLEARAWDEAGNLSATPSIVINITNYSPPPEDRIPPRIRWLSPASGSTIRDTVRLEFEASDNVGIDSLQLFSSGELAGVLAGQIDFHYILSIDTWRFINGSRVFEVRAYDAAGNVGISNPISLTVDNHRVIWVPDDSETIQGAINASVNGDTIMVRAGTYREQLQFFDKNVSFVSEFGPEVTTIDLTGYYCTWITGGQDTTMLVRGFRFFNESNVQSYCIGLDGGASPKIFNNIFELSGVPNGTAFITGQSRFQIRNNLFINLYSGGDMASSWGDLTNNMIINSTGGFQNAQIRGQPLRPDYNLFWRCQIPNSRFPLWGDNNVTGQEPQFDEDSYRLREGSPGIDMGRPDIQDLDQTRSDIGVYGGPYAY